VELPDQYNTVYDLRFDDPELAGTTVKLRRSYGLIDAAAGLRTVNLDAIRAGMARPEDMERLRELVDEFADALVAWNLTDDGAPVPTTRAGVRSRDLLFVLALVAAFVDALTGMASEAQAVLDQAADESSIPMTINGG
jgi:hypothetical protein